MNPQTPDDLPVVRTFIDFASGSTGYITVDSVIDGPTTYAYMPLRSLPHMELSRMMREQGQVVVRVRLKSGTIVMVVTALSPRSITLVAQASVSQSTTCP